MAFRARTFSSTNTSVATVCGGFCSSPLSQTFAPASRGLITSLNLCSVDFHGLSDSSINGAFRAHSCARQGLRMTGPLAHKSSVSLLLTMKFQMNVKQKNFKVSRAFIVTPSKIKTRKTFLNVCMNADDREDTLLPSV